MAPSSDALAYVHVTDDGSGSDFWRLDEVADAIKAGKVGVIPTDTKYAFVCDLESRSGVQQMYDLKRAGLSKPMSILCRGFGDIDRYTQGFPDNVVAGRQQPFKLARQCLPGPYTFILNAGKALPKVCLQDPSTRSKSCKARKTVGVRVSANAVCAALLERLDRPLLASTVPETDEASASYDDERQDPAMIADAFEGRGLAFVVDAGVLANPPSTVLDLTKGEPKLLRRGAGDAGAWVGEEEEEEAGSEDEAWGF